MRVALVHDWLTGMRGGERVLEDIAALFPDADLYTLVHVPGSTSEPIERLRIHASPLSRIPGIARRYRLFLPLFPWAIGRFHLRGYDLVLSTSHAVAKSIPTAKGTLHVCYCFTPMRYVWDQADAYLGRGARRLLAAPLVAYLRRFDRRHSGVEHVSRFIAISRTVAERIARTYGRTAEVIHPPVDTDRFRIRPATGERPYLLVAGFVPYKREDLVLEAFREIRRPLLVVGDGPARRRLEARAPAGVRFLGRVSDRRLAELYAGCRALVYPQEEDFGIVPLEAQACGRPVIAFGRGGATETVIPPGDPDGRAPTGLFFQPQTPQALADAVRRFEAMEGAFLPEAIRRHAEAFSRPRFRRELAAALDRIRREGPRP